MVEEQTNIDTKTPNFNSKFFHNKISVGVYQLTLAAQKTIDPRTLLAFLGPVGLILIIFSMSQIFKTAVKVNLLIIIFASGIIIFTKSSVFILVLMAAWQLLALQGVTLLKNSNWQKITFVLLILTFWYFSIDWKMPQICNDIKFN